MLINSIYHVVVPRVLHRRDLYASMCQQWHVDVSWHMSVSKSFLFLLCNPYITLQNPTDYTVFEFILPGIQSSLEYFLFTSPMLLPRINDGFSIPICVPGGFPFASQRFRVIYVSIISIYFALILLCKPDRLWITVTIN